MINLKEEAEMTDLEIRLRYGTLIEQASMAFSIDAGYAADITKKAKLIEARRAKRKVS